ncbi:hypothetical protein LTR28_006285 [Elasticomyces elasticus]|nr:hypothetical protein LTR28_006285 [Elasticomyces elasticus]
MSNARSSSGVRNLRAMFENTEAGSPSPSAGDRPANDASNTEKARPLSKVRTSFVSVELSGDQTVPEQQKGGEKNHSTASLRRDEFSMDKKDDKAALNRFKKTVSDEHEERQNDTRVGETTPESMIEASSAATPADKPTGDGAMGNIVESAGNNPKEMALPEGDTPASDLGKPTSAADHQLDGTTPVHSTNKAVGVGGEVLPQSHEGLRKGSPTAQEEHQPKTPSSAAPSRKARTSATRPAIVKKNSSPNANTPAVTLRSPKSATTSRHPVTQPKSPAVPKTPVPPKPPSSAKSAMPVTSPSQAQEAKRDPSRKASRTSLTASTASSAAKSKPPPAAKPASAPSQSKPSATAKPRPKSPTRSVKVSNHLTAPTASSAAKHDPSQLSLSTSTTSVSRKPSTVHRTRPPPANMRTSSNGIKPTTNGTARSKVALSTESQSKTKRPESRSMHRENEKTVAGDSFLTRMMRPTTASSSKVHDKTEVKSPPRRAPSVLKGKTNGSVNGRSTGKAAAPATKARPTSKGNDNAKINGVAAAETAPDRLNVGEGTAARRQAVEGASAELDGNDEKATHDVAANQPVEPTLQFDTATIR